MYGYTYRSGPVSDERVINPSTLCSALHPSLELHHSSSNRSNHGKGCVAPVSSYLIIPSPSLPFPINHTDLQYRSKIPKQSHATSACSRNSKRARRESAMDRALTASRIAMTSSCPTGTAPSSVQATYVPFLFSLLLPLHKHQQK